MTTEETILTAARLAADTLLALVPADQAKQILHEQSVKDTNALADAMEALKFGMLDKDEP